MILLLMLCGQTVRAQQEAVEYKMEVGGGAGATFYLGDANSTPYAHMGVMGGAVVRRIFNPRMCVKGNLAIRDTRQEEQAESESRYAKNGTEIRHFHQRVSYEHGHDGCVWAS